MSNYAAARAASKRRKLAHPALPLPTPPPASAASSKSKFKKPEKSTKTRTERAGNLAWKNVVLPSEFGFDEEGGLLELEEVEGVEVIYGDGLVTFRVSTLYYLSPRSFISDAR